jgi:hypothetical protein
MWLEEDNDDNDDDYIIILHSERTLTTAWEESVFSDFSSSQSKDQFVSNDDDPAYTYAIYFILF